MSNQAACPAHYGGEVPTAEKAGQAASSAGNFLIFEFLKKQHK